MKDVQGLALTNPHFPDKRLPTRGKQDWSIHRLVYDTSPCMHPYLASQLRSRSSLQESELLHWPRRYIIRCFTLVSESLIRSRQGVARAAEAPVDVSLVGTEFADTKSSE